MQRSYEHIWAKATVTAIKLKNSDLVKIIEWPFNILRGMLHHLG